MRRSFLAIPAAAIVFAGSAAAAPSWVVTLDGTAGVVPGMSIGFGGPAVQIVAGCA